MKARRKWFLGAIALALALAGAMAVPFFVDEPPPDDADLRVTPVEVPHEKNGFHVLDVKKEDIRWPGVGRKETRDLLRDLAAGKDWDSAAAREILEENAEVLRKLDACLRLPRFQFPDEPVSFWVAWVDIAHLALIRMQAMLHDGRSSEALDQAWAVVTFGQRLQEGRGDPVHFFTGMSAEGAGLAQLRNLTRRDDLDPHSIFPLARRLQSFSSWTAAEVPMKRWYEACWSELQSAIDDGTMSSLALEIPSMWRTDFCLKPNQTKRLLADAVRALIAKKDRPESWGHFVEVGPPRSSWLSWLPRPNGVGQAVVRSVLSMVDVENLPYRVARTDLDRALTAALIALKCWEARHGALPPTLDALVPEYLDAVPRDPYDGKPLRYSAEKRILYSVGGDGQDAGGSGKTDDEEAFKDGKEPTLRIEVTPQGR